MFLFSATLNLFYCGLYYQMLRHTEQWSYFWLDSETEIPEQNTFLWQIAVRVREEVMKLGKWNRSPKC